jgi:phosphoribosylformylglycinamidine (FGAM) synthase PurS component
MIFKNSKKKLVAGLGVLLLVGSGVAWRMSATSSEMVNVPTFQVQQGDLQINVLQGGEIRALRNEEMRSEIEINTKIISLIPEGYLVTEKDVQQQKVLVELDNSELKNRIQDNDILFQTTVASYIEADEAREIQKSENLSLAREQRQTALFALMDFEKYLGKEVASRILADANLPDSADSFDTVANALEEENTFDPEAKKAKEERTVTASLDTENPARVVFTGYLSMDSNSDGEAQQRLRQLADELLVNKSELAVAKQKVESSERLAAKDFISKAQLENDQVNLEKVTLLVKTAETQLDLFKKYEFAKQCETFLSAYREALNKLRRTVRANRSKMAQAESRFQTAKRRYDMELAKKEDLERQLRACTITASTSCLVAYGNLNASYNNYSESIQEGATIRLRQTILTIPDMTQMGVSVKVHESQVKKVRIGQPVLVKVDAEPGKILHGKVAELAVLPDSASSRYTPNLKVYPCTIHIEGTHPWLKPGMNAKVEIIIQQLADVMYVPVQSIEVENDQHFCYVESEGKLERREVTTGAFNDDFIEVQNGLHTGDTVALSLPKRTAAGPTGPNGTPPPAATTPAANTAKAKTALKESVALN